VYISFWADKIRKNVLSLVCATCEGKQGLKGKLDCYFASILGVCVETADQLTFFYAIPRKHMNCL
jgi:hypothetical protein